MTHTRPMQPIDAFAALGRIEPSETSLREVLQRVVDLAVLSIPDVTGASVSLLRT